MCLNSLSPPTTAFDVRQYNTEQVTSKCPQVVEASTDRLVVADKPIGSCKLNFPTVIPRLKLYRFLIKDLTQQNVIFTRIDASSSTMQ